MITREVAYDHLASWVKDPGLLSHCLTLEKVMTGLAARCGLPSETQLQWGLAGLLHDADWEKHPKQHPRVIVDWLKGQGEDAIAAAIASHGAFWGVPHASEMSRALVASDELTGFIVAYARVRPDGLQTLRGVDVVKKLRNTAFATGVDRGEVHEGTKIYGASVEHHADVIIGILCGSIGTST